MWGTSAHPRSSPDQAPALIAGGEPGVIEGLRVVADRASRWFHAAPDEKGSLDASADVTVSESPHGCLERGVGEVVGMAEGRGMDEVARGACKRGRVEKLAIDR